MATTCVTTMAKIASRPSHPVSFSNSSKPSPLFNLETWRCSWQSCTQKPTDGTPTPPPGSGPAKVPSRIPSYSQSVDSFQPIHVALGSPFLKTPRQTARICRQEEADRGDEVTSRAMMGLRGISKRRRTGKFSDVQFSWIPHVTSTVAGSHVWYGSWAFVVCFRIPEAELGYEFELVAFLLMEHSCSYLGYFILLLSLTSFDCRSLLFN
ncbi:hypothetical protein B0H65DRAFT_77174 [Neurospora tetraspora]|uniref:Uncharacterized protein n=1 Tax=Neurospora tetraspora TaxID=94610 RepID=A0AAE0J0J9_9PEZI|nr:hypothetical protein B0H65DRAFT_77174 [Neurospora tetraspora]